MTASPQAGTRPSSATRAPIANLTGLACRECGETEPVS
ncbi:MAG: hypothetical protein ACI867_000126, partial [Glaciecola sp.]